MGGRHGGSGIRGGHGGIRGGQEGWGVGMGELG